MPAELPAEAAVLNQGSWRDDGPPRCSAAARFQKASRAPADASAPRANQPHHRHRVPLRAAQRGLAESGCRSKWQMGGM